MYYSDNCGNNELAVLLESVIQVAWEDALRVAGEDTLRILRLVSLSSSSV